MAKKKTNPLFETIGLGLEYMLVDRGTLMISAQEDDPLNSSRTATNGGKERREVSWSGGRAAHVLVMKALKPLKNISALEPEFRREVRAIHDTLSKNGRMLLGGGAHPLMDPRKETVLWKNDPDDHHALYDRVFDRRSHNWSNSQCLRLELPFANDDEFGKLHTAIRMVLPIIPALSAASPIINGKVTGMLDTRLHNHIAHDQRIPVLMGSFIPEVVITQEEYYRVIFEPIARAIQPFGKDSLLDYHRVNSRGAVAYFDRGIIELRVVDTQECPSADLAIAEMIVAVVKAMVAGKWVSNYLQRAWHESDLLAVFKDMVVKAGDTVIANKDFLLMFGLMRESATANELWRHLYQQLRADLSEGARMRLAHILDHGCLAQRIIKRTGNKPSREGIIEVYRELATCLQDNKQLA